MVLFLDTNIIIDFLADREPFAHEAEQIFNFCKTSNNSGIIAAQSILDTFYILRKVT